MNNCVQVSCPSIAQEVVESDCRNGNSRKRRAVKALEWECSCTAFVHALQECEPIRAVTSTRTNVGNRAGYKKFVIKLSALEGTKRRCGCCGCCHSGGDSCGVIATRNNRSCSHGDCWRKYRLDWLGHCTNNAECVWCTAHSCIDIRSHLCATTYTCNGCRFDLQPSCEHSSRQHRVNNRILHNMQLHFI